MKINVEIDRISVGADDGTVFYLTREGARDLQRQLDDILGPVESDFVEHEQPELGPFTVIADPLTVKWDSGTAIENSVRITSGPPINFTAPPWDFM